MFTLPSPFDLRAEEKETPRGTPKGRSSPLPAHQAASSSISFSTQIPKYTGHLLYPAPPRPKADVSNGMEALGLLERRSSRRVSGEKEEELDPAVHVAVNPRFGLVAVGNARYDYFDEIYSADNQWESTLNISPAVPLQTTSLTYIRPQTFRQPPYVPQTTVRSRLTNR